MIKIAKKVRDLQWKNPGMRKKNGILIFMLLLCLLMQTSLSAQEPDILKDISKSDIERTLEDKRAIEKRIKQREKRALRLEREKARKGAPASGWAMTYQIIDGDTVFTGSLTPVFKFDRMRGNRSRKSWRQYKRLVYNFKKTYPYALQAKEIIHEADSVLATRAFSDSEREEYISSYQKKLFKQFEKPLRKLTISQGKLLMKLIDRELGRTSFYIIREYRGKLAAGFWQTVARVFGNDLKKPYDRFGEDRMVEDLIMLYNAGAFDALYYSMFYE